MKKSPIIPFNEWIMRDDFMFYTDYYKIIGPVILNKNIEIGNNSDKKCRFCEKNSNETSFTNISHAIPEMLGNHTLIANDECDSCNALFSKFELDLGIFTYEERFFSGVTSKSKMKQYQTKIADFIRNDDGYISIRQKKNLPQSISLDENKNPLIPFEQKKFIPFNVFKSFVKMAISTLPESELDFFDDTKKWLLSGNEYEFDGKAINSNLIYSYTPGQKPYTDCISYTHFIRKDDNLYLPHCFFYITFTNFTYQFAIPLSDKDTHLIGKMLDFPFFPGLYPNGSKEYGETQVKVIDLEAVEKQKGRTGKIKFEVAKT